MTSKTKVVISTVGPFARYGNNLMRGCVKNGTDYCDISGEVNWMRYNINKYKNEVTQTGARIVSSCGVSSTAWDLATFLLNEKAKSMKDELLSVYHENDTKMNISGGALQSLVCYIDGEYDKYANRKYKSDPLSLKYDPEKGYEETHSKLNCKWKLLQRGGFLNSKWRVMSPTFKCNSSVLLMSQSQLGYRTGLSYTEYNNEKSIINVINQYFGYIFLYTTCFLRPLRKFMMRFSLLPNSGQGPSPAQIRQNYLKIVSRGETVKGKVIKLESVYNEDMAYKGTAKILAECGLCFVFGDDKIKQTGGFYSPVSCFGMELKNRLEEKGYRYFII